MYKKFANSEYLSRTELYSCLDTMFEDCSNIMVARTLTDYSGNFDEIYNEYAEFNLPECEQMLADFYLDNVMLDGEKNVEHIYYVPEDVSTYLKFEALRVSVYNQLGHKTFATTVKAEEDFVVFDDEAVICLDITSEGALKGGYLSTNKQDVEKAKNMFLSLKKDSVDYLKKVPAEASTLRAVNKKIKELKSNLNLK